MFILRDCVFKCYSFDCQTTLTCSWELEELEDSLAGPALRGFLGQCPRKCLGFICLGGNLMASNLIDFECYFKANLTLKLNFVKTEFQNSIRRLSFCAIGQQIAWINPCNNNKKDSNNGNKKKQTKKN